MGQQSSETIAFIFARGGSKGLVGKNIKLLAGKPLIGWSIEHARAISKIRRIIVSTDDDDIAAVATAFGAEVPFRRPAALSGDNSPEWKAWQHALSFLQETEGCLPKLMVSVPTTAPLRSPSDIESCIERFEQGDADIVVTATPAHRSPYFNMVTLQADGTADLVNASTSPLHRRQEAPAVYDLCTVAYACDPRFVLSHHSLFEGRVRAVLVPQERALDIDTGFDFLVAESLMLNQARK